MLWAYRNSPKDSTRNTSYKLVYGYDAMLPVEVNLQSIRLLRQNELLIDDYWNSMFDELNKLENERLNALENIVHLKEVVARSYNKRVKFKEFKDRDLC